MSIDWSKLRKAVEAVAAGDSKRTDIDGATVYAVGPGMIRVDIKKEVK